MAGGSPTAALMQLARRAAAPLRRFLPPRPAILMYHRIADERFDPWGLAVSPASFAEQLQWLARNRTPLPLADIAELADRERLPADAIALTFDDGYACNADTAAPLLERFGVPATIFLPAALTKEGREFWWDELAQIVLEHRGAVLRFDGQDMPLGRKTEGDADWPTGTEPRTERQHAYRRVWTLLHAMAPAERNATMAQLRSQSGRREPRRSHGPMTVEEVRRTRSSLVEFGSHALTHASLPALTRAEKAGEIRGSMERCAELVGARPRSFAYPYGDYDAESERLVEEAGFSCACTTDAGFVSGRSRRFALPRIWVGDWDSRGLARLLGAA